MTTSVRTSPPRTVTTSEIPLRAILAATLDPLVAIDSHGIILFASDSTQRFFGWKPEELVGRNVSMLMPEPHRAGHEQYLADYHRTGNTNILGVAREFSAARKDGSTLPCEIKVARVDVPGHDGPLFTAIIRDISEHKNVGRDLRQSESRLGAILAASLDPLVTINARGIIEHASFSVERVFGWKPEELVARNISVLMPEPDRSEHDAHLERYRRTGKSNVLGERREATAVRKNGETFPCELNVVRVDVPDSDEPLFTGIIRDLSDRKKTEQRLEEHVNRINTTNSELRFIQTELVHAVQDLECSNRELDDFAYIASHDLKEPLRGIHNYASFLLEDYADRLDEEGRSKLQTLMRLTHRLEDLVDGLLYFSRVGRLDLAIEDTDLNEVVAEALESLAVTLEQERVDVRIPRPLPTVTCDRSRIGEVFRNLITNAVKYNDNPEKWIEIGCDRGREQDPATATQDDRHEKQAETLYVRDNGIGIREKHHDSIFGIFKRLHARDKYGGGTGAGLTIVKKIVERHGGGISVTSVHGQGSTFRFTLTGDS